MKFLKVFFIFNVISFAANFANAALEIRDTETEAVLGELIAPLARAAGVPNGRMKIHILGDNDFNAFTAGGEDIYIYTGLISHIENPNTFQAVIAHEMGHMIGGHMVQLSARMRSEMQRALVMQALGVALMVANPGAGAGVLAGSTGIAQQSLLSFSRDEERIADDMGIDLLVKAKLPTYGFIDVMKIMQNMQSEERLSPFKTNHPLTNERLTNVKNKLKTIKQNNVSTKKNQNYNLVRAKLVGYLENADRVANLYPKSNKTDEAIYARSIAAMRIGNLEMAKTGILTLVTRKPNNPYFYEVLGDIEYQFGHYDDSIVAYDKSIDLLTTNSNKSQIQTALALVLGERKKDGDIDKSIELAKRAILTEPAPLAYYVLARAYGAQGNNGKSDWAMAEYYNLNNNDKLAKKYAKSAMDKLLKKSPEYLKSGDILKSEN